MELVPKILKKEVDTVASFTKLVLAVKVGGLEITKSKPSGKGRIAPLTALPAVKVTFEGIRGVWSTLSEKDICGNMLIGTPVEPFCGPLVAELKVGATVSIAIVRLVTGVIVGFEVEVIISPSVAMPIVKALLFVSPLESVLSTTK